MHSRRAVKDRVSGYLVAFGGIGVIAAIVLIFFYLLYVVVPVFSPAEITHSHSYPAPGGGETLYIGVEEQGTVGVRFIKDGRVVFFDSDDGSIVSRQQLDLPAQITSVAAQFNTVMLGLADGRAIVLRYVFDVSYPGDARTLTPRLEFPLGDQPVVVDSSGNALTKINFRITDDAAGITAGSNDNRLLYVRYALEQSFLSDSATLEVESEDVFELKAPLRFLLLDPGLRHIYAATNNGTVMQFPVSEDGFDALPVTHNIKHDITSFRFLLGGISVLIGLDNGEIQQWMPVRTENGDQLTFVRGFHETEKNITALSSEQRRKGFAAADEQGRITVHYATSHRTLADINTAYSPVTHMAWSARAEHLLAIDKNNQLHMYEVHNEYPEVSWSVLWGKVWYEGYQEPDYIWQSSASNNDFEPKLSLVPLSFGTIKAAFYAMLFAVPVAILGAIFTAQFMAPRMRQTVKPAIEIMEALPTVILGFLAGLWLAPLVEDNLAGVFSLLIILPAGFLLCAWLWRYVPGRSRFEGWEAAILIPVVLILIWLSMELSMPVERLFFDGDLKTWLSQNWGLDYDQRNSLVVGLIMGFAVIPTIFSIAEDALFSVPQHLIRGSLALGATHWQTLMRVVIPAASPGIFSALMMGFGRAVGETMIVLMATGNTPVMDMSIFQGMRTLSANIAVEVPESEVGSTHYRVLFLAALVLFMFTFVFNTGAEIIRQRLRKRYSAL